MYEIDISIALEFICEAKELVNGAEESILQLEGADDPTEQLSAIFRMAHNLKGSGRAVGFTKLGDFVHLYEDVIGCIQSGTIPLNSDLISFLLKMNDHINKYLDFLTDNPNGEYDTSEVEAKLIKMKEEAESGGSVDVNVEEATSVDTTEENTIDSDIDDFADKLLESNENQENQVDLKITEPNNSNPVVESISTTKKVEKANTTQVVKRTDEFLRIRLSKLDAIIDSLGELLIYQSMLNETRKDLPSQEYMQLHKIVDALNGITKEMQDVTITLRMLPLQNVFAKMNRIVRELSVEQDKKINFTTTGDHVELDKIIVDSLSNPLTHMIRNAIDHGIETPEDRVKAGKTENANLELSAKLDAGVVRITIKDDGRGLSREKILAKAKEKGLLNVHESQLSDNDVYRFIMESGFSTKEQVTDVSGRGVGMDVVRTIIESLNGNIEISSKVGEGTHFQITLPLSLSIVEAMLIISRGERFIVPLAQLTETLEIGDYKIGKVNDRANVINIRNEEIPLFNLSSTLGHKNKEDGQQIGIVTTIDGVKYAFSVDRIVGTQSVVVKDLGIEFSNLSGLSGSAILGDGKPGLILDLPALVNKNINRKAS